MQEITNHCKRNNNRAIARKITSHFKRAHRERSISQCKRNHKPVQELANHGKRNCSPLQSKLQEKSQTIARNHKSLQEKSQDIARETTEHCKRNPSHCKRNHMPLQEKSQFIARNHRPLREQSQSNAREIAVHCEKLQAMQMNSQATQEKSQAIMQVKSHTIAR